MNNDQLKGKWSQLKGKAKIIWGELTDDDFKKAEGSAEKRAGIIQARFGGTKEASKDELYDIRPHARNPGG